MAVKVKYKLKQEKGVLHIGGGRFFYPGESYKLTAKEVEDYGHYFEEEEVEDKKSGEKQTAKDSNDDGGGQNPGELPKEPPADQQEGKEEDKK